MKNSQRYIICVSLWLPTAGFCASFDCNAKLNSIEALICSKAGLSISDEEMASAYKKAKQLNPDVINSQKAWLKQRNACKDIECLRIVYADRIKALTQPPINELTPAKTNPTPTETASLTSGTVSSRSISDTNNALLKAKNVNSDAKWDIVGVKIGNSIDEAKDALKSSNPELIFTPIKGQLTLRQFVSPEFTFATKALAKGTPEAFAQNPGNETIGLVYDISQNNEIISVIRKYTYPDDSAPSAASMEQALKEKYGQPVLITTNPYGKYFYWIKNSSIKDFVGSIVEQCLFSSEAPMAIIARGGPSLMSQTNPVCGTILVADVRFRGDNSAVVWQTQFNLTDTKRVRDSDDYVNKILKDGAEAIEAKQKMQADKVKPKL